MHFFGSPENVCLPCSSYCLSIFLYSLIFLSRYDPVLGLFHLSRILFPLFYVSFSTFINVLKSLFLILRLRSIYVSFHPCNDVSVISCIYRQIFWLISHHASHYGTENCVFDTGKSVFPVLADFAKSKRIEIKHDKMFSSITLRHFVWGYLNHEHKRFWLVL